MKINLNQTVTSFILLNNKSRLGLSGLIKKTKNGTGGIYVPAHNSLVKHASSWQLSLTTHLMHLHMLQLNDWWTDNKIWYQFGLADNIFIAPASDVKPQL